MTPRFPCFWRRLPVLLVLATGCSYPLSEFTVDPGDASTSDTSTVDTSLGDVAPGDATPTDTTAPLDSTATDTTVVADSAAVDTRVIDSAAVDSTPVDSGVDTTLTCPGATASCGAPPSCRATHDDPKFCSTSAASCGTACGASQYCRNGTCDCRPGLVNCGSGCVDILGQGNTCGMSCGVIADCTGGKFCDGGKCKGSCPGGRTTCGASCFDLANDPNHCGGCTAAPCNSDELCLTASCKRYVVAITCATKAGCDCSAILPGSIACDPFSGTTGSHPICVIGTSCPVAPWK